MTMLTGHDADLILESFKRVRRDPDSFAAALYGRLFEAAPEVRPMFPEDLALQREKLVATLWQLVRAVRDLDGMRSLLERLGDHHREHGVLDAHYVLLRGVLVEALADRLGRTFTPEHASAWGRFYDIVAAMMTRRG